MYRSSNPQLSTVLALQQNRTEGRSLLHKQFDFYPEIWTEAVEPVGLIVPA